MNAPKTAASGFKSMKVAVETYRRIAEARRLLVDGGARGLPSQLHALYAAASTDVSARHKQIGMSVAIDLGIRLLLEALGSPAADLEPVAVAGETAEVTS